MSLTNWKMDFRIGQISKEARIKFKLAKDMIYLWH